MPYQCRHCQSPMREGIALASTLVGEPDFPSSEAVTLCELSRHKGESGEEAK